MAMNIKDQLVVEVADSDAAYNRRLINTRANTESETRSYYTNDDITKHNAIVSWFNGFSQNNIYQIDGQKTKQYVYLLQKLLIPNSRIFINNLQDITNDCRIFLDVQDAFINIPRLGLTGTNNRYLRFDNSNNFVSIFRKLIIGRITTIVINKEDNVFKIWLEFHPNFNDLILRNGGLLDFSNRDLVDDNIQEIDNIQDTNIERITGGYNKIYYGVPGCGKSFFVKEKYELEENIVFRTTFHMDYTNSDFIGQIMPKLDINDNVVYDFIPGIFSKALLSAYKHPNSKTILIIEEINRGNAAAIFGDVFQLLDRDNLGNSIYSININNLENWLKENEIDINRIIIPSNLYIVATMNTSDQNVFTLDTAFKRRWDMQAVSNNFEDYTIDWFDWFIPGSKYTWKEFVNAINEHILSNNIMSLNTEDKRLGIFFVSKNELVENFTSNNFNNVKAKAFAYKVLMYIWDDISKINKDDWFEDSINSLDKLIASFLKDNEITGLDSLSIFKGLFPNKP